MIVLGAAAVSKMVSPESVWPARLRLHTLGRPAGGVAGHMTELRMGELIEFTALVIRSRPRPVGVGVATPD